MDRELSLSIFVIISIHLGCIYCLNGRVVELDLNSYTKALSSPGGALIKFYAPWCGYCRKFEEPYSQAAEFLASVAPNLIVARIDGTTFPGEASSAGVRGYPTVFLFKDGKSYPFHGERTADGVVSFVKRVLGPAVETLESQQKLDEKIRELYDDAFFLYLGTGKDSLWTAFNATAEEFRLKLLFYSLKSEAPSSVFVCKDGGRKAFHTHHAGGSLGSLLAEMKAFVEQNQESSFSHVTASDLTHMSSASPATLVCVFLVDYVSDFTEKFKNIGRSLAFKDSGTSLPNIRFAWSVDASGMSSLAMAQLDAPNLLLFYPANGSLMLHPHYTDSKAMLDLETPQISAFLIDAVSGKVPRYGGNGYLTSIQRFSYDLYSAFRSMFKNSPLLALVIFGVPLACVSCLCYCLCCASLEDDGDSPHDLAAVRESQRVRLAHRRLVEAQMAADATEANFENTLRARSIYGANRIAERNQFLTDSGVKTPSENAESRKDK